MPFPADTTAPPLLADYELLKLIGRGSYGDVWLARGVTGVFRAVKIVWRERFPDLRPYAREFEGVTRFASVSLREPSQLALLHAGRNDEAGFFYYVMELADDAEQGRTIEPGGYVPLTLKELRTRRGRLPPAEVLALGVALARALATLHATGLVHRDIKPSNVVLVGGVPKLADVGLVAAASAGLTFVGTEGFVPPEGPGAPAADVFSLGKVLYELATGLDRQEYPRLPPELSALPDRRELLELNEVFVRACHPQAASRHPDAAALLDELLLLQAGKSVRRLRATERHLGRALRAATLLAIAASVAIAGAWFEHRRAASAEAERDLFARRRTYSGNLASAQRALGHEDYSRARRLLQEIVPRNGEKDLRGFEWHALWREAQGDPHDILREKGPAIHRLAVSPDGSLLSVHDDAKALSLYDTHSQREQRRITGVRNYAGFSADGRWLVGTDEQGALRRWSALSGDLDTADPGPVWMPVGPRGNDQVAAFSPGSPTQFRVWDFVTARETLRVALGTEKEDEPWVIFRAAGGRDDTWAVACVRGSGSAAQFRLTSIRLRGGPEIRELAIGRFRPSSVGVDAAGPWAALDTTGEIFRDRQQGWVKTSELLPPGTRRFIGVTEAEPLSVAAHGRQLSWLQPGARRVGRGHSALISDVVVAPSVGVVFSAAMDGSLFSWSLAGPLGAKTFSAWDSNAGATNAVFGDPGNGIWVPADGASCIRLDERTLSPTARVPGMLYPVALADAGLIGVASDVGLIRANPSTGEVLERKTLSSSPIRIATSTAGGARIAAIDHRGDLLALEQNQVRLLARGFERYFSLGFDRSGNRLFTTSTSRDLLCVAWPNGQIIWNQTLPALAPTFLCLPDNQRIVVALETGLLEIRDATNGVLLQTIDSGSAAPQALAVTPDGSRLFAGGHEGNVHCFDIFTGEEVHALPLGDGERLHRLVCSPDGRMLAGLTKTGRLHVIRAK